MCVLPSWTLIGFGPRNTVSASCWDSEELGIVKINRSRKSRSPVRGDEPSLTSSSGSTIAISKNNRCVDGPTTRWVPYALLFRSSVRRGSAWSLVSKTDELSTPLGKRYLIACYLPRMYCLIRHWLLWLNTSRLDHSTPRLLTTTGTWDSTQGIHTDSKSREQELINHR